MNIGIYRTPNIFQFYNTKYKNTSKKNHNNNQKTCSYGNSSIEFEKNKIMKNRRKKREERRRMVRLI